MISTYFKYSEIEVCLSMIYIYYKFDIFKYILSTFCLILENGMYKIEILLSPKQFFSQYQYFLSDLLSYVLQQDASEDGASTQQKGQQADERHDHVKKLPRVTLRWDPSGSKADKFKIQLKKFKIFNKFSTYIIFKVLYETF